MPWLSVCRSVSLVVHSLWEIWLFFFPFVAEFSFFLCVINIQTQNVLLGLYVIHPNMNVSFQCGVFVCGRCWWWSVLWWKKRKSLIRGVLYVWTTQFLPAGQKERLWRKFFVDPSQWWDGRLQKVKMSSGFLVVAISLSPSLSLQWRVMQVYIWLLSLFGEIAAWSGWNCKECIADRIDFKTFIL